MNQSEGVLESLERRQGLQRGGPLANALGLFGSIMDGGGSAPDFLLSKRFACNLTKVRAIWSYCELRSARNHPSTMTEDGVRVLFFLLHKKGLTAPFYQLK